MLNRDFTFCFVFTCFRFLKFIFPLDFEDVEAPVGHVEEEEGDREDEPRVLVDDVDVLDLRDDRLHRRSSSLQVMHQPTFPLLALAAGRAVPAGVSCLPADARRPEGVAAVDSETRREVSLFAAILLKPDEIFYILTINIFLT